MAEIWEAKKKLYVPQCP